MSVQDNNLRISGDDNQSNNNESDNGVIIINLENYDLESDQNDENNPSQLNPLNQTDSSIQIIHEQPKEEIKDGRNSAAPSVREGVSNEINASYQNSWSMNVNTTEGGNLPPSQPQQVEDVESNNSDLVVKLNFADLDALANDDDPNAIMNIKQDEDEDKNLIKISTNDQAPVIDSTHNTNTVAPLTTPPTPIRNEIDLQVANVDVRMEGEEYPNPKAEEPIMENQEEEGNDSDEDMRINIPFDEKDYEFNEKLNESQKSQSAISFDVKKAEDGFEPEQVGILPDKTPIAEEAKNEDNEESLKFTLNVNENVISPDDQIEPYSGATQAMSGNIPKEAENPPSEEGNKVSLNLNMNGDDPSHKGEEVKSQTNSSNIKSAKEKKSKKKKRKKSVEGEKFEQSNKRVCTENPEISSLGNNKDEPIFIIDENSDP